MKVVVKRELIRFVNDGKRTTALLFQAVMWLFVVGAGFGALAPPAPGQVPLQTFMFPGILVMTVITTAMFSAASIVWDREFGFLREMLVAPVSRTALALGKIFGGALVATAQSVVVLSLAGFVGVPYHPLLMAELLGLAFLIAFTMTAFGVMVAARISSLESFLGISQMVIMPLTFLSGALFPIDGLHAVFRAAAWANPLTYAVEPVRQAVLDHLGTSAVGRQLPGAAAVALLAVLALIFTSFAVAQFRRAD
ncbi:ABC transporter permease [Nonomuraea antri]|uniref:ABC transporter permease n=1 Tax=Nonomuraea antri TaxID=2730852 RepID=UPI002E29BB86|nr:ABC transporter permease [Nonomuraea antri]